MRTRLAFVASVLGSISGSVGVQTISDPTFNGFAKLVHCNTGTTVACLGDACAIASTGGIGPDFNMWISLAERRAAASSNVRRGNPITIQEVSPAVMNKDLYVKFAFQVADTEKTSAVGLLFFHPLSNGSYSIIYGQTTITPADPLDPFKPTRIIRGGTCDLQN